MKILNCGAECVSSLNGDVCYLFVTETLASAGVFGHFWLEVLVDSGVWWG
jgi:hypothetical protein